MFSSWLRPSSAWRCLPSSRHERRRVAPATHRPQVEELEHRVVPTTLTYPDFSSVAGLQLNGSAAQAGTVLLIDAGRQRAGRQCFRYHAGHAERTVVQLAVSIPDHQRGRFANGFTFTLQVRGKRPLGGGGGGKGYVGITPSIAVEFELFSGGAGGPNTVGVFTNGNTGSFFNGASADIFGSPPLFNSVDNAWVDYDGPAQTLRVYVSASAVKPA